MSDKPTGSSGVFIAVLLGAALLFTILLNAC
jgi:hypothetical protein